MFFSVAKNDSAAALSQHTPASDESRAVGRRTPEGEISCTVLTGFKALLQHFVLREVVMTMMRERQEQVRDLSGADPFAG